MNETSPLAEHRFCAQCGAERLGLFCWRCGAPARGEGSPPPERAVAEQLEPFAQDGFGSAAEAVPSDPGAANAAALRALWERVSPFVVAAAALAAALAALAFPALGLPIGLGALIALGRALRARPLAAADAGPAGAPSE